MTAETKSAAELATELQTKFDKSQDEVKAIAEKALAEAEKGVKMTESTKAKTDEALLKMNELNANLKEVEQLVAKGFQQANGSEHKSIGQIVANDEGLSTFLKGCNFEPKQAYEVEIKADLSSARDNSAGAVGVLAPTTQLPGHIDLPQRRLVVRDLLSPGRMDTPLSEYFQETGFTNNAGMVAEGAAKPKSDIKFDKVTFGPKVIAHWMQVSNQVLSDVSQIRSIIDNRLLYGLSFKEESQLLFGDGTSENLHGIVPQASSFVAPFTVVGETPIDRLRLAMLQAVIAEYPATGHVLNDIDWAKILLTKNSQGNYIIGNPQSVATPSLWGLPVVTTQSMLQGKFLTGAFKLGAQVFDRWSATVSVGMINDNFIKNQQVILAEERVALAVYRPESFIYGDVA